MHHYILIKVADVITYVVEPLGHLGSRVSFPPKVRRKQKSKKVGGLWREVTKAPKELSHVQMLTGNDQYTQDEQHRSNDHAGVSQGLII